MSNTRFGDERAEQPGSDQHVIELPAPATNTQGELAGIGDAAEKSAERLEEQREPIDDSEDVAHGADAAGAGTNQPPRMGGPFGPDPKNPHLPEGAQDGQSRGTGAGGFDRGVDATTVGAVHQGAKPEDR